MNVSAIVVMLWSLLVAAQTVPGSRIEGTVVDAVSGKPISGARVMVIDVNSSSAAASVPSTTASAADGRFVFENVQANRLSIAATKPGYPFNETYLTLAPGSRVTNLVVRLIPTGIIAGRVIEPNGRPAVNANVMIQQFRSTRESYVNRDVITTNDRGEFRADLEPGSYLVAYSSSRGRRGGFDRPSPDATGLVLYPGATETGGAVAVEVKAGEETRVRDVVLTPVKATAIRLHIINDTGQPPPPVIDFGIVDGSRPSGFNGLYVNVEGGWDREITREYWPPAPGMYAITAGWRMPDAEGVIVRTSRIVEFTGANIDVELKISKDEGRLRGRVMEESANGGPPQPFSNARVTLRSDTGPPIDDVFVKPDGTFSFSKLPLGRYEIRLEGLIGDYYMAQLPPEIVVGKDETAVDITVASGATTVRGKVIDSAGRASNNATVGLVPVSGGSLLMRFARADQNGAFELPYVIPGAYRVYAFPAGMFRGGVDTETLKKYETRAQRVTLEKRAQVQLTIPLLD